MGVSGAVLYFQCSQVQSPICDCVDPQNTLHIGDPEMISDGRSLCLEIIG